MNKRYSILAGALNVLLVTMACGTSSVPGVTDNNPLKGNQGPDTSGPCYNVLLPLAEGKYWVYQDLGTEGGPTPDPARSRFSVTVAEVSGNQASINILYLGTNATSKNSVECQDGAILNIPTMVIGSFIGDFLGGNVQVEHISGIFLPSEDDLEAAAWNMTWEGKYVAGGDVTASAEGDEVSITLNNSPITVAWKIAGQETVTVPAGTYEDAYKIRRTTQAVTSISFEGNTGEGTLTFVSDQWFAPYVGLLKTELISGALTVSGFTFPFDLSGTVVLTETR